jgi:MFS family permease
MQSLIHGNFEGAARAKVYALVGASAAIAAAIGPLIGGVITTFWSWRINFLLEALIIAVVLVGSRLVRDVAYEGERSIDFVGAALSVVGMGGVVLGILVWQEGGEAVLALIAVGVVGLVSLAWWLTHRKRVGKPFLLDPGLFASPNFRIGISQQMLQQITLGGAMIVIPIFLQIALGYNALEAGLAIAPLSLSMFFVALIAGKRVGRRRPAVIVRAGFAFALVGMLLVIPVVPRAEADQGAWVLLVPLLIAGSGLGMLVSQLNNFTLAPIEEERASEAAGVNSAAGNFGLSFGLAVAGGLMLATLSFAFTTLTDDSTIIPADQKQAIATAMEDDAQVVSDDQLQALLVDEPADVQVEILAINDDARALSLQVAMLIPVLACLLGLINAFRMVRLPDIEASSSFEGLDLA